MRIWSCCCCSCCGLMRPASTSACVGDCNAVSEDWMCCRARVRPNAVTTRYRRRASKGNKNGVQLVKRSHLRVREIPVNRATAAIYFPLLFPHEKMTTPFTPLSGGLELTNRAATCCTQRAHPESVWAIFPPLCYSKTPRAAPKTHRRRQWRSSLQARLHGSLPTAHAIDAICHKGRCFGVLRVRPRSSAPCVLLVRWAVRARGGLRTPLAHRAQTPK